MSRPSAVGPVCVGVPVPVFCRHVIVVAAGQSAPAGPCAAGVPVVLDNNAAGALRDCDAETKAERYFVHAWSAWVAFHASRSLNDKTRPSAEVVTYARALAFWMTMTGEARAHLDVPSSNEAALAARMAGGFARVMTVAVLAARLKLADARKRGLMEHIKTRFDHAARIAVHRECKLFFRPCCL